MKSIGLAVSLALLLVAGTHAGPNEGATLVAHGNVDGLATNGDPCTSFPIPGTCFEVVNVAQPDGNGVEWFIIIAAGEALPQLTFNTITFGLGDYNTGECYIGFYGPCTPEGFEVLEIPSEGWPGPSTGTAVSWAPDCREGDFVPVYYFGVYAYGGGGTVPLADEYPNQNAAFVSCESPPTEDPIAGFGEFHCGDVGGPFGTIQPCGGKPATEKTTWGQIKRIYHH